MREQLYMKKRRIIFVDILLIFAWNDLRQIQNILGLFIPERYGLNSGE